MEIDEKTYKELLRLYKETTDIVAKCFIVPTQQKLDELMGEADRTEQRIREITENLKLTLKEERDLLIEVCRELLKEEMPAFQRSIYEREIEGLRSVDLRTVEGKESLELAGDILAGKLIDLIKEGLQAQIPLVIKEELAKQPRSKVERALEEAGKGKKVKAKEGCMVLEIGDVAFYFTASPPRENENLEE